MPGITEKSKIPSSYDTIKVGVDTEYATSEDLANIKNDIAMPSSPTDKYNYHHYHNLLF